MQAELILICRMSNLTAAVACDAVKNVSKHCGQLHITQIHTLENMDCKVLSYTAAVYTLSGRIGSALVWHTQWYMFVPRLLHQVLRFLATRQSDLTSLTQLSVAGCGRL